MFCFWHFAAYFCHLKFSETAQVTRKLLSFSVLHHQFYSDSIVCFQFACLPFDFLQVQCVSTNKSGLSSLCPSLTLRREMLIVLCFALENAAVGYLRQSNELVYLFRRLPIWTRCRWCRALPKRLSSARCSKRSAYFFLLDTITTNASKRNK